MVSDIQNMIKSKTLKTSRHLLKFEVLIYFEKFNDTTTDLKKHASKSFIRD